MVSIAGETVEGPRGTFGIGSYSDTALVADPRFRPFADAEFCGSSSGWPSGEKETCNHVSCKVSEVNDRSASLQDGRM